MNYKIRPAGSGDLPKFAEIHVKSWSNAYQNIVPQNILDDMTEQKSLQIWQRTFQKYPQNLTLVEQEQGEIVAICCAGPCDYPGQGFDWEIYGLHVMPSLRNQGIGAALLQDALTRAHLARAQKAIVWTIEKLDRSRKFYQREGGQYYKTKQWPLIPSLNEVSYYWDIKVSL